MKMMKKVALGVAFVLGTSALFAEGVKVGGLYRTDISSDWTDLNDGKDPAHFGVHNSYSGYNLGIGPERLRINVDVEDENAGVTFRYQQDGAGSYFTSNNVKWAMGYVNFNDKLVTLEAGKLTDRYTGTNGRNGYSFDGEYGIRGVVFPVEGLAVAAQIAGPEGNYSKDLAAVTCSYGNDAFGVQAGYKLDGQLYYGFDLKCVENLTFIVDGIFRTKEYNEDNHLGDCQNKDFEYVSYLRTDVKVVYDLKPVRFGACAELTFVEDHNTSNYYPFVEVDLSDTVTPGLSAGIECSYTVADSETIDGNLSVTPEVTYKAGKVTVQGYYMFAKDKFFDYNRQAVGVGFKYDF